MLRAPEVLRIRGSAHQGFDSIAHPNNSRFNDLGVNCKTGSGMAWQEAIGMGYLLPIPRQSSQDIEIACPFPWIKPRNDAAGDWRTHFQERLADTKRPIKPTVFFVLDFIIQYEACSKSPRVNRAADFTF